MNELSDKNKPRNLEDIFREGMGETEIPPSDRLWERIDHKLDTKEAVFYRERMVWFQRLAAACILLVLFTGGYLFYNSNTRENPKIATYQNPTGKHSSEAPIASKIKTDSQVKHLSVPADNLSATGNTIAAKAQGLPVYTQRNSLNKPYRFHRNKLETIAISKSLIETGKLIDEAESSELNNKASNLPVALIDASHLKEDKANAGYTEEGTINFWAGLQNKAAKSDTSTAIALNKSLPVVAETSFTVANDKSTKKESSRWAVSGKYASHYFDQNIALAENSSAVASPNQSSFVPPAANGSSSFSEAMQEYDKNTMASYSFNTALGAAYQINNHWALETGLAYTQNVATTNSSYVFNNSQSGRNFNEFVLGSNTDKSNVVSVPTTAFLASLAGSVDANNAGIVKTESFDTHYRYRLIGIPVKVNYKTNGEKSYYYVSGGLLTNFLMQADILSASPMVPDIRYSANTNSPFNDLQMAGTISVGRGFKVTKGFNLKAGLEASKYFTRLAAHPENLEGKHGKPYTIGIALSSSYSLGK